MDRSAEVRAFVEDRLGRGLRTEEAGDILRALGADGDDAFELMQAFFARFGVDPRDYRWYHHHAEEGMAPTWPFRPPDRKVTRMPITLADLETAAGTGTWPVSYPDPPVGVRLDRLNWVIWLSGIGVAWLLIRA